MTIRPVDLNGMIQRTQDVGNMKQQEDSRPVVQQHNIEIKQQKSEDQLAHQVTETAKGEKEEYRYDAKEKGNGSYEGKKQKKKEHKKEQKQDGAVLAKNQSRSFDIKI